MKNKSALLIATSVLVLVGLFIVARHFYQEHESERIAILNQESLKIFVPDHAIRKGSTDAKVYVVEFFDPECESCREFYPYLQSIMKDYEGKIQLVMRYAPFHGNSIFAIKILEAARLQGKYWEALELLYQHQPEWGNHHNPRPELLWNYLPELNLDIEKLKADMENPAIQKIIEQDQKDAQSLNVTGTPEFFVNGKALAQFGPDFLKSAIEDALKSL